MEPGIGVEREIRRAGKRSTSGPRARGGGCACLRRPGGSSIRGLDIAFDKAGIGRTARLHELAIETFDDVLATNARGGFLATKYEFPHLIARGGGVVVVTSSSAVDVAARPAGAAYSASKRASRSGAGRGAGLRRPGHPDQRDHAGPVDAAFVRPLIRRRGGVDRDGFRSLGGIADGGTAMPAVGPRAAASA
ncbi:SDR family NAD(P)-dependent oxidoreductase [Embleya sp. NPDC020630]|uniref:SDR family NAD(P)-dependent oxidoreductase n=1 Tax=Embleya sp. NPDC020630 TaxID=3363979 RepID=UPI0037A9B435